MDKQQLGGLAKSSVDRAQGVIELPEALDERGYREIPIERIRPDPDQPRKSFPEESLFAMAETVAKVGILQPLTVEYDPGSRDYKIVIGERRFRAAKTAGLERVPCLIREVDEEQRLLHQLIENLQKEDLNPIEKARGIQLLMHKFNYTQRDVARALGKKESTISEDLSVLKSPEDIQEKLLRAEVPKRTAVQIATEKDPDKQKRLVEKALQKGTTSDDIRRERSQKKDSLNLFVYETRDGKSTVKSTKSKVNLEILMGILREAYMSVKRFPGGL